MASFKRFGRQNYDHGGPWLAWIYDLLTDRSTFISSLICEGDVFCKDVIYNKYNGIKNGPSEGPFKTNRAILALALNFRENHAAICAAKAKAIGHEGVNLCVPRLLYNI